MVLVGERVLAVITSQLLDNLKIARAARTPKAGVQQDHGVDLLDNARFIAQLLVAEGFELLHFHPVAISFAGTPAQFERVFGFRPRPWTFPGGRGRHIRCRPSCIPGPSSPWCEAPALAAPPAARSAGCVR